MTMRTFFLFLFTLLAALPVQAAERAIVVFDASGSMWGQIDGKTRIEIARQALSGVLGAVPPSTELGLMVYGHREKGSCSDIELAVPPEAGSAAAISAFINAVNPKGKTPLTDATRQAAEALRYTEEKSTVILVTDGLETCNADPCALGKELEASGVDFTAHVVGFGLTKEEGQAVACLAENTGGKYLQASDAGQLAEALAETVAAPAPEPTPAPAPAEPAKPEFNVEADSVLFEGGPSLADDDRVRWDIYAADPAGKKTGDAVEGNYRGTLKANLADGHYVGIAKIGDITREVVFDVKAGEIAKPVVNFDAGSLKVTPKFTENGEETGDIARVDAFFRDGQQGSYGTIDIVASAGPVTIKGDIAEAKAEMQIDIKAGERKEVVLVIPAGLIVPNAAYAEGSEKVDTHDLRVDIFAGKKDISGNRKGLAGSYGPDAKLYVPAGEHVFVAKLGTVTAEMPVSVAAGERAEPLLVLNAGVLAIAAPGARRIDIFDMKKDISGNQKGLSGNYGEKHDEYMSPGEYEIRVEYEGDTPMKTAKATVKAGERTEITVQ